MLASVWANLGYPDAKHFAGLLGAPILMRYTVRFAFDTRTLRLIEPATYTPPAGAVLVPFELQDDLPVVRAHARHYPKLSILHFDAHPDLYDEFGGNRFSHASPFARIMEEGLAGRLVQVGVRTLNPHQREQARRFGVDIVEMRDFRRGLHFEFEEPVYVSIDLDALDPAFAPGVSHHEPGGMSVRDLLDVLRWSRLAVVGADVVEFNPVRDLVGMTAALTAKLVKELAARMQASTSL